MYKTMYLTLFQLLFVVSCTGQEVDTAIVELYRDSSTVEKIKNTNSITAYLLSKNEVENAQNFESFSIITDYPFSNARKSALKKFLLDKNSFDFSPNTDKCFSPEIGIRIEDSIKILMDFKCDRITIKVGESTKFESFTVSHNKMLKFFKDIFPVGRLENIPFDEEAVNPPVNPDTPTVEVDTVQQVIDTTEIQNNIPNDVPIASRSKIEKQNIGEHHINYGDNLKSIATKYQMSVKTLKTLNNIKEKKLPANLKVLKVEYPEFKHIVKEGETKESIAKLYGLKLDTFLSLNKKIKNLKSLEIGQELNIKIK